MDINDFKIRELLTYASKEILKECQIPGTNLHVKVDERDIPNQISIILASSLKISFSNFLVNYSFKTKSEKSKNRNHADLTILQKSTKELFEANPDLKVLSDKTKVKRIRNENVLSMTEIKSTLNRKGVTKNAVTRFYSDVFLDLQVCAEYQKSLLNPNSKVYMLVFVGRTEKWKTDLPSKDGFLNKWANKVQSKDIFDMLIWVS